jgi:predicted murein hydrolase (TIGR00659 family)
MNALNETWIYLSASPLMHLTMTLFAYQVSNFIYEKSNKNPIFNPVMLSIILIICILMYNKTSYQTYFNGAQFVHFLLGPATVALAIPLYRQLDKVKRSAVAIVVSILSGSIVAVSSAVLFAKIFSLTNLAMISLAPKSVTAPVAMGISEKIGGLPSLTAIFVISTGILGAIIGQRVLLIFGIKNQAAIGLALGTASHGIGTARALQISEEAGAFSSLAMGFNALATAVLLPLVWSWFM